MFDRAIEIKRLKDYIEQKVTHNRYFYLRLQQQIENQRIMRCVKLNNRQRMQFLDCYYVTVGACNVLRVLYN